MLNREHLSAANRAATRRKDFRLGLLLVVIFGGFFGYYASDWFLSYVPSYVGTLEGTTEVDGVTTVVQVATEDAASETLLLIFGLFGVIVWPAIFSLIYLLLGWWFSGKHEEEDWKRETALQEARESETAQRIAEAKARGDFDRWSKNA